MRITKPSVSIKPQAQMSVPVVSDATIMDDTVMTMDGLALMGGPTVTIPVTRQTIVTPKPSSTIKVRR